MCSGNSANGPVFETRTGFPMPSVRMSVPESSPVEGKRKFTDDVAREHVQVEPIHGLSSREDEPVAELGDESRIELVAFLHFADDEKPRGPLRSHSLRENAGSLRERGSMRFARVASPNDATTNASSGNPSARLASAFVSITFREAGSTPPAKRVQKAVERARSDAERAR